MQKRIDLRKCKSYNSVRKEAVTCSKKNLFLAKLKEKSLTQEDAAKIIGVASTTLYRKMIGHSDFTRNEIQLFRSELGLTAAEVDNIFFG